MNNASKQKMMVLIAILASAAFSQVASALPIFARQTGFSCTQCHFQNFPLLNAFGRSFKNTGFTMIGSQAKVVGDGLSIPQSLNFGVLVTAGMETVSNPETGPNPTVFDSVNTPAGGGELSLFYGGRVTENIGFLTELGAAGSATTSSAKLPLFYEVANGTRVGVVFLTTAEQGAAHSFETLNTGAVAVQRMVPMGGLANDAHIKANSAAQYLGTKTGAQGASFVLNSEKYFINVGKYAVISALGTPTRSSRMGMTYARAAKMFDMGGFDSAVGVQLFRGDDAGVIDPVTGVAGPKTATEATIIDGQMQGTVGKMPLGVYFSYGTAPATTNGNLFNSGGTTLARSLNVAGQLGIAPHTTVMTAVRLGKTGGVRAGEALTDDAIMVGATYGLAVNVEASLSFTSQSGTAWSSVAGVEPPGKNVTTLMLEAVF